MKHTLIATSILLAACAETTGGASSSSSASEKFVLVMDRHSETPRGGLTVSADGLWLYTSDDACKFVQGHFDEAKVAQIRQWVSDKSLEQFRARGGECTADQYLTGSDEGSVSLCLDPAVMSESGKALIQLFHDSADKVMWDGVKRECKGSGPGTLKVSSESKNTDPPPPANHSGAGSGG